MEPNQPCVQVTKQDRFAHRVILCVWWNFEGVVQLKLVPNDARRYSEQLDRAYAAVSARYPALVNRKRVLLQHDNAPTHTTALTKAKISKLSRIEVLRHPEYGPDLVLSDYHLFRSGVHYLRGGPSILWRMLKTGTASFSSPNRRSGIAVELNNWHKDG